MSEKPADQVQSADAQLVKEWYDRNEILLIDVRESAEYEIEHIPGALLLPLSSFEAELFPTIPGKKVVLHCAIGKRSAAAGKMLLKEGHRDVIHLSGGLDAWKAAGYATEVQCLPPEPDAKPEPVFLCPLPGHVLRDEYLKPLKIPQAELGQNLGISDKTVAALIAGDVSVGVELSLRLARYFSTAADFWVHLQLDHDLEQARHRLGEAIRCQVTPRFANTSND